MSELLRLDGKGCIVTGGATGIGFAIARRMAEAGARVLIADVNDEKARNATRELQADGYRVEWTSCDVGNSNDVKKMVRTAIDRFGAIDILVCNAGIFSPKQFITISDAEWQQIVATNLTGAFYCGREVSSMMIEQGRKGCIINIGSISSIHASPLFVHYDATKGGVLMLTKSMARELAPHGIRVNAILPGPTKTGGWMASFADGKSPENEQKAEMQTEARIPIGRLGTADDAARIAVFLASEASSFIVGTAILADGGLLLR